ncbi:MAG: hypothetical protein M1839_005294 [Geoglossum umbratile]|nr:MAG: hypothetical protein M1839_005294 [Geoglossum umbratile]
MDLMRQLLVDASHTPVDQVVEGLLRGLSKAEALARLQEIINAASYYDEQIAELVSAAWELIISGQLWDQTFESIYELEQIMSFDTAPFRKKQQIRPKHLHPLINLMNPALGWMLMVMCECVGCEMLTLDYIFPDPPPHWGKNKSHWYCSGGGQSGWEQHERERRWITACLAYYGHPRHKEDWNDITTEKVAAWVECQGMGF